MFAGWQGDELGPDSREHYLAENGGSDAGPRADPEKRRAYLARHTHPARLTKQQRDWQGYMDHGEFRPIEIVDGADPHWLTLVGWGMFIGGLALCALAGVMMIASLPPIPPLN